MTYRHHLGTLALALVSAFAASAHAANITLSNGNFNSGNEITFIATGWTQTNGGGTNNPPSNYWLGSGVPDITSGAAYLKSDGGNFIQQAFNTSDLGSVNAATFGSYTVGLDYGYRRDSVRNGAHTIRISLWNVTDNVEIAGTNVLIADPLATGANALISGSFNLNYDNTLGNLAGDQIAIRLTSASADLGLSAWNRTAIVDNISITAVGSGFSAWAAANAPDETMEMDHDDDGVPNGIEYFMGLSGSGFTANPAINADRFVSWPKGAGYSGTYDADYVVEISTDLDDWSDVPLNEVVIDADSLDYTLPAGGPKFARLKVTGP